MKKKLLTLLFTVIAVLAIATTAFAYTVGDLNSDSNVNATDALLVLKHAAKISPLSNDVAKYADIDWDGNTNATDALFILKYAAKIDSLPDNNPYFYDMEENNGFMMNKLPYTVNGMTISSISVDTYGCVTVNITNNSGKAIGDFSFYNVKLYNVDNELIKETSFSIRDLDNGETGVSSFYLTDNTYKIVFTSPKLYDGISSAGVATETNSGIVTNKLPYTVNGISINSFDVDKYGYVTLNATNNTGKAITGSSYLYYKCYDSNGYVIKSSIASLKEINNGQSCSMNFYLADGTEKMIIYAADLKYNENLSALEMADYNGISVNKLPYTDSNKLTINSIKFSDNNAVEINVSNNTGKAIKDITNISYKCVNSSGTVVRTNTVYLCNMNSGENCNVTFYKTDDTAEIIFYESKIYEGTAIANVSTATYDGISVNKLPADFGGLKVESISFEDNTTYIMVTNNTGKTVGLSTSLSYRCLDSNGTILMDSAVSVQEMNSGEKCKTSFYIPENTAKIIFFGYKIYDSVTSPSVSLSNYNGISMNTAPYSSNGLKINSYTVDNYSIKVSVTNETGSAISSSSSISYKCYDSNGVVIGSGATYLNNMNNGDTYETRVYSSSEVAKIVFYDFVVK